MNKKKGLKKWKAQERKFLNERKAQRKETMERLIECGCNCGISGVITQKHCSICIIQNLNIRCNKDNREERFKKVKQLYYERYGKGALVEVLL